MMLKYVEGIDEFLDIYARRLSNRLIMSDSISDTLEDLMLQMLKDSFGLEHVGRLKTMFKDMKSTTDLKNEFSSKVTQSVEFVPLVLTKSIWPLDVDDAAPPALPDVLTKSQEGFEHFYRLKFPNRVLRWVYSNSVVVVQFMYTPIKYKVSCSLQQFVVLDCLQNPRFKGGASKDQLKEVTKIDAIDPVLETLLKPRIIGLKKDSGHYALFPKFTSEVAFFSIIPKHDIAQKEESESKRHLEESRKMQVCSCIVRIMKAAKKMDFQALKNEVIAQLQHLFTPTPQLIRAARDYLVEKEYLKTVGWNGNNAVYEYIS
jgi:hypothetical protein